MYSDELNRNYFDKSVHQYDPELVDNPPLHTMLETEAIIKFLKKTKVNKVADFGAGTGRITLPLLQHGYSVTAIDVSSKSLSKLKKLASHYGFRIPVFSALGNKRFDSVVGCDVLHHVNFDSELKHIYQALTSGGSVVFSEPGAGNPSWYIYFLVKGGWKYEQGLSRCSYFNLQKAFRRVGFKKVTIHGLGIFPRSLTKLEALCKFNDWLGNLPVVKLFAYRYLITASK